MADRAKKKEKHRLKREKKQQTLRKASALTPLQLISRNPKHLHCLAASDQGLTSLFVYGTAMDGRHALAVFLIDKWCVGLKDAYGWPTVTREQFDRMIEKAREAHQGGLADIDAGEAKSLLASAIRFSRQNGFRLPPDWDKWANVFGGLGDVANADLSSFGKDGGLMYIGTMEFLENRLIGCTPREFFARPGVNHLTEVKRELVNEYGDYEAAENFDEDEDEIDDEAIDELSPEFSAELQLLIDRKVANVVDALRSQNVAPHPRLREGIGYIASLAVTANAMENMGMRVPGADQLEKTINDLMSRNNESDPDSLWEAIRQILRLKESETAGSTTEPLQPASA